MSVFATTAATVAPKLIESVMDIIKAKTGSVDPVKMKELEIDLEKVFLEESKVTIEMSKQPLVYYSFTFVIYMFLFGVFLYYMSFVLQWIFPGRTFVMMILPKELYNVMQALIIGVFGKKAVDGWKK